MTHATTTHSDPQMNILPCTKAPSAISADLLVVGVPDSPDEGALHDRLGAFGAECLAAAGDSFKGKAGQSAAFPTFGRTASKKVVLVGTGSGTAADLRLAAGKAASVARADGSEQVALALGNLDTAATIAVVEGLREGLYRFDKYKAESSRKAQTSSIHILGEADWDAVQLATAISHGRDLARDLVNEPADVIYPETLAAAAAELASDRITVDVWDYEQILAAGMGGIDAVGKGSDRKPRFVHLVYKPEGTPRKRVGLIGKGVTYDAGGLNIKPGPGLQTMRCDMGGAATVIGVFRALRDIQPDVEVHGIIGTVENLLGGSCYKLGDVLHISNGMTVEVHNTDAEGRLVLADCLSYASKLGLDAMVDIATLTGAAIVALGERYTGLFTDDDDLASALAGAAAESGEDMWRLPLEARYKDKLKAEWADVKNVGGRAAGSITAALFLSHFVEDTAWAHLDIAGPAFTDKALDHFAAGGLGAMVPTLVRWSMG
jgi:leucyl aminopeptidase